MSASARNPGLGAPPTELETAEFLRAFANLEPADRTRLARLIEVLADEQDTEHRPYTARLDALRRTPAAREGFWALLLEFSDN